MTNLLRNISNPDYIFLIKTKKLMSNKIFKHSNFLSPFNPQK